MSNPTLIEHRAKLSKKRQARKAGRRKSQSQFLAALLLGLGLLALGTGALLALVKDSVRQSAGAESALPVAVHFPAPQLNMADISGSPVSLESYRGQVVLVNNWATWCPPCQAEMPTLEAYYQAHRHQNFTLIGIEAGQPAQEVAAFVEQFGLSFPIWLDPQNLSLRGFYNTGLPNSYVIDPDGTVILGWSGPISLAMLEKHVTPLLKD